MDKKKNDFQNIIKKDADILILAGDIGNPYDKIYDDFIQYCSKLFIHVLIVAGNHEYYDSSIYETDIKINDVCKQFTNTHYLNNKIFKYNEIIFIGTTLWSEISKEIETHDFYSMNDYNKIKNFSPYLCNKYFNENLKFITDTLNDNKNDKCVIITHHAPSYKCIPKEHIGDILNCCYASNLDFLFKSNNLIGWIYGHTHYNYIEYTESFFLYANCYRTTNYENSGIIL
jgi:predicted phosphohydrolase